MDNTPKAVPVFWLLLLLFICAIPLFWELGTPALRLWDESRRAVNALEMTLNGDFLVPHFMGAPDNWGTKPPLLVWCQSFFLQFIDVPELAIRLPSALAGLFTALLLVWGGKRLLGRPLVGCFAAVVLITSNLYINPHGAIAGDYDALLTLWLSAQAFCFYLYLKEKENRWLYLTGIFVILAGWTKGIAAFFFAPGLLLYALSSAENRSVFRQPKVYGAAILALLGILAYYFLRESLYPGYLTTVWENELGGRYLDAKEGHSWGFGFYFRMIYQYDLFFPWLYFLPLGFAILFFNKAMKPVGVLFLLISSVFMLVISNSATKLVWYVLPVFPLLALVVGVAIERMLKGLLQILPKQELSHTSRTLFNALFFVAIFSFPYLNIVKKVNHDFVKVQEDQQLYRDFFRELPPDQAFTVVSPRYNGHLSFYQKWFNHKDYAIEVKYLRKPPAGVQDEAKVVDVFPVSTIIVFCEDKAKTYVEQHYNVEQLQTSGKCQLVRLTAIREQ